MSAERISSHGLKPKTVEKIIHGKINSWLYSLKNTKAEDEGLLTEDEKEDKKRELAEFRDRIRKNVVVSGGCITSLLLGEKPNDYDIYFKDLDVAKEVANYYITKLDKKVTDFVPSIEIKNREDNSGIEIRIKSLGILSGTSEEDTKDYRYFEMEGPAALDEYMTKHFRRPKKDDTRKYYPALITGNAITLTNDVQLILRFVGEPDRIHDNYDFVHVTNYYTAETGLVLKLEALTAIMSKTLKYVGSKYPMCSLFRLRKFIQRGWSVTAGEMLKIGWDINALKLDDPKVLADQLTGVDFAYMTQILRALSEGFKKSETIDRTYIVAVIDRIFDDEDFTLPEENTAEEASNDNALHLHNSSF